MNKTTIFAAALALATGPALADTPLIDLPFQAHFRLDEHFMDVHIRTTERLIACHKEASIVAILPQLYPEVGYSIIDAAIALGEIEPFHRVRIREDGDGTMVSLKTTSGSDTEDYPKPSLAWLEYWVRGGTACVQGPGDPPPL